MIAVLTARGFRRNLGTGKSLSFVRHKSMQAMETLVLEFGEIEDDAVNRAESAAILKYSNLLNEYSSGSIHGLVSVRNIGKGADWSVIVLTITGIFFAIPETHKKVRESIEEWQLIFKELKSLYLKVIPKKFALYPDQYLFLIALNSVISKTNLEALVFVGFSTLPEENPDLDIYPPLLFSFQNQNTLYQYAVARHGELLWENQIQIAGKIV